MTDRVNGFFVVLDEDIREDDVETIRKAILMVKHVIAVKNNVVDPTDFTARARVRSELLREVVDLINKQTM